MARHVEAFGVAPGRIHVIANWCDDETIRPIAPADNPLRERWKLAGKFVVGYSGNLGRAHEFDTVLAAAERLRNEPHIIFLMIGGGKRFEELIAAVKAHGLENSFRFEAYQPRAMLPYSLGVPDVQWLSLNPQQGLIVPSKFYGIAAAGRPIVMIGAAEGEIGRLVQRHRCGVVIRPGDAALLADTLRRWSNEPQITAAMGARSRQLLELEFSRRRALDQWSRLINQLEVAAADGGVRIATASEHPFH
jgi:colanic acid biosynthesis glycosyl transferase WcaI